MVAITVATNVTVRTGAQGIPGIPGTAAPHAVDHEAGGDDEVTIEDLVTTGTLGQVPTATASGTVVMATPTAVITAHGALTGLTPGDVGHTDLQLRSEKGQALGYAELDAGTLLDGAKVPYGSASDTATEGNDSRVPTQGENDALVGTDGTPATGNPYVTNSDPRNSDARAPTAHTIFSHDTDTTGAELTSLADGSDADLLHDHAIADAHIASTANPHSVSAAQAGAEPSGSIATHAALADAHHAQVHTIVSHDTTATGDELDELTDGSETTLHSHASGGGDVTSPGGETAGRITKFTGSKAVAETATTETELATAVTHSGIVTGNPHALDASDVSAEPSGSIATHAALSDAHHPQIHTIVSHDTTATGANLTTLTDDSDADALHVHAIADAHIADVTGNPHAVTATQAGAEPSGSIATHAALPNAHHNEVHTILSHDTDTTGAELTALADGSDVSTGHLHSQYAELSILDDRNRYENFGLETLTALGPSIRMSESASLSTGTYELGWSAEINGSTGTNSHVGRFVFDRGGGDEFIDATPPDTSPNMLTGTTEVTVTGATFSFEMEIERVGGTGDATMLRSSMWYKRLT